MRHDRRPAWLVDLKWMSAIALVLSVAIATVAASAARVTAPTRSEGVAREVLTLVLGPAADEIAVTVGARGYEVGEPLAVLPGIDVYLDPTEIEGFTAADAASRVAGVLTDRFLTVGGPATWAAIEDDAWSSQLRALDETTLRPIANAALQRSLLGVGLDNGTRAANWPAQAAQNPGQDVQPLVGIFVRTPPQSLAGRSPRQIGELVVDGLAEVLAEEGAASAQALVTNPNVGEALRAAIDGPVRRDLHAAIETAVASRHGEIAARIADARAVAAGTRVSDDPWAGVLDEAEAAGLAPEERRERVQGVLARRAAASGSSGVLELVEDGAVAQRVSDAAPVVDAVARAAHRRYVAWAWIAGAAAVVAAAILALVTRGPGRALWPGVCLAIAAGPPLLVIALWRQMTGGGAWPSGPVADGAVASLWRTMQLAAGNLAPVAAESVYWVFLLVAGTGAALMLVALAAWVALQLRPRRRSLI